MILEHALSVKDFYFIGKVLSFTSKESLLARNLQHLWNLGHLPFQILFIVNSLVVDIFLHNFRERLFPN